MFISGAHTHFGDIRASWGSVNSSWDEGQAFYSLLSTPAISPCFGNNPGFTSLDLVDGVISNIEFTFLDLNETIG